MVLRLQSKSELTAQQLDQIDARLRAPEHSVDWSHVAMPNSWTQFLPCRLFALFDDTTLVALAAIDGAPHAIDPAWWVDRRYRETRCGSAPVQLLAPRLVSDGVSGVKHHVPILGPNDAKSRALVDKLRRLIADHVLCP